MKRRSFMGRVMAVYDVDPFYADRFADTVNQREKLPFTVMAFTTLERLKTYAKEHAVDLLLISSAVPKEEVEAIGAARVVTLADGDTVPAEWEYPSIYKYQSSSDIVREVMACYCKDEAEPAVAVLVRAATVIGRDPNDAFYGFSIDQGTLAGISVGDPVITQQGLVGVVTQAYATTSKVTTLLSEDVNVSAVVPSRGESGVISSDITSASAGLLRLSYLSNDTQVQKGDIVTTSGVGGTYPADVIIGQVQSVQKSENDISNYAVIKPYEDLTSVQDVFVVIDFPGAGDGEEIPVGQDTSGEEDAE